VPIQYPLHHSLGRPSASNTSILAIAASAGVKGGEVVKEEDFPPPPDFPPPLALLLSASATALVILARIPPVLLNTPPVAAAVSARILAPATALATERGPRPTPGAYTPTPAGPFITGKVGRMSPRLEAM